MLSSYTFPISQDSKLIINNAALFHTLIIDRVSGYGLGTLGDLLDDLGNGDAPGYTASGPDGDGKAKELLREDLGISPRVETSRSHR